MELSRVFQDSYKQLMQMCLGEKEKEATEAFEYLVQLFKKALKKNDDVASKVLELGQECFTVILQRCPHTQLRLKSIPLVNHELSSSILADVGKNDKDPDIYNTAMKYMPLDKFPLLAREVLERPDRYSLPVRIFAALTLGDRNSYSLLCKDVLFSDKIEADLKIIIFSKLADNQMLEAMLHWLDSINVSKEYAVAKWVCDRLYSLKSSLSEESCVKYSKLQSKIRVFSNPTKIYIPFEFSKICFNAEEKKSIFSICLNDLKYYLDKIHQADSEFFREIIVAGTKHSDSNIRCKAFDLLNPDNNPEDLLLIQQAWLDKDPYVVRHAIYRTPKGKYHIEDYKRIVFSLFSLEYIPFMRGEFHRICGLLGNIFVPDTFSWSDCLLFIHQNTFLNPRTRDTNYTLWLRYTDGLCNGYGYDLALFNLWQKLADKIVFYVLNIVESEIEGHKKGVGWKSLIEVKTRRELCQSLSLYLLKSNVQFKKSDSWLPTYILEGDILQLEALKERAMESYTYLIENMTK